MPSRDFIVVHIHRANAPPPTGSMQKSQSVFHRSHNSVTTTSRDPVNRPMRARIFKRTKGGDWLSSVTRLLSCFKLKIKFQNI